MTLSLHLFCSLLKDVWRKPGGELTHLYSIWPGSGEETHPVGECLTELIGVPKAYLPYKEHKRLEKAVSTSEKVFFSWTATCWDLIRQPCFQCLKDISPPLEEEHHLALHHISKDWFPSIQPLALFHSGSESRDLKSINGNVFVKLPLSPTSSQSE